MSIELNANSAVSLNTDTAVGLKTANLVKSQKELEGQMALDLIATAVSLPASGNSGQNINIKV
tara:strand:- start:48 stop:236 length:189 start_codon:yes stop_codon:yes gene_type:complete